MKICLVMLYQMVEEQNLKRTRQTNLTVDAPTRRFSCIGTNFSLSGGFTGLLIEDKEL